MKGYSLPELLVALVCSSFLMLIMVKQFMGVKQHYTHAEALLESKLEMQMILDLMRASIRQAGFTPCLNIDQLAVVDTRNGQSDIPSIVLPNEAFSGFQVNRMSSQYSFLVKRIAPTVLSVTKDTTFTPRRPILIADCYHAEVHTLETIHALSGVWQLHLQQPLMSTFHPPVYIGEWYEEQFFTRSNTLLYHMGRSDALTNTVQNMSVSLSNKQGKRLVNVLLSGNKHQRVAFSTFVRSA